VVIYENEDSIITLDKKRKEHEKISYLVLAGRSLYTDVRLNTYHFIIQVFCRNWQIGGNI